MGQVVELKDLRGRAHSARRAGKTIVLANGAFDLFHLGHLHYLQSAKKHADVLVVAVNSDESVRQAKGEDRPIVTAAERAAIVAAIDVVDYVVIFPGDTAAAVIETLRPDVHAKGTDYDEESIPEATLVRSYGGTVAIAGPPKAHSTTGLIERLQRRAP